MGARRGGERCDLGEQQRAQIGQPGRERLNCGSGPGVLPVPPALGTAAGLGDPRPPPPALGLAAAAPLCICVCPGEGPAISAATN